jgi:hypothetical protein
MRALTREAEAMDKETAIFSLLSRSNIVKSANYFSLANQRHVKLIDRLDVHAIFEPARPHLDVLIVLYSRKQAPVF